MNIKGHLIGMRRYSFTDQTTGNTIQGGKLAIAVPSEGSDSVGHSISEIPYPYEKHGSFSQLVQELQLSQVLVTCDVSLSGRKTKLSVSSIKAA